MRSAEEDKKKMIKAIEMGNVVIDTNAAESIKSMKLNDPDFTVTGTILNCWGKTDNNLGGFEVLWQTVSAGFGSATFYIDQTGKLCCENEGMSRRFLRDVLSHLVGNAILSDTVNEVTKPPTQTEASNVTDD